MRHPASLLLFAAAAVAADVPVLGTGLRQVLLNPLDGVEGIGTGGWKMGKVTVGAAAEAPKLGVGTVRFSGIAEIAGGKGDCGLHPRAIPGCRRLGVWVHLAADANVARVGLQFADASGEVLLRTWDADWTGWRWLDLDLADPAIAQAYPQDGKDGKADAEVRWVNLAWFAKAPGPSALTADALVAAVDGEGTGIALRTAVAGTAEPGQPLRAALLAENAGPSPVSLRLRWRLQRDPQLIDPGLPDPVDGVDHARGAASWVEVDGKRADALLTDDDPDSAYSLPWGKGYAELTGFLDLGQERKLTRLRWKSGDANWIRKVDVSASLDGTTFTPVPGLVGIDLKGKWGWSDLPWPAGTPAKVLRFRLHDDGKTVNRLCLAGAIAAFDGIANDIVALPEAGATVAQGEAEVAVPGRAIVEAPIAGGPALTPGAYLLGLEILGPRRELRAERVLVAPADTVPVAAAGRFGINVSTPAWAASLRRVGFGWVRFENCKWAFFSPAKGQFAFDGSVAPWHVDQDATMGAWKALDMKVLPYVFVTPEWATSAPAEAKRNRQGWPPQQDADYGDAVYQAVARFGSAKPGGVLTRDGKAGLGLIDAVELWNEPNLNDPGWGPYVGSLAQYFATFRAGAEAAKRADPKLPVSAAGWAGIDLAVVGTLAEHRYADGRRPIDFADIVNVHFYSGKDEPETCGKDPNAVRDAGGDDEANGTYWQQLHDLAAWRQSVKPAAQIWLTETGYDVGGPIGRTERHQAAKLPRCIMLALAAGLEKVFIYRETGSDPSMHAGAGLLRNDGSIRPVWYTVATMIRQLQGLDGPAVRLLAADPADWLLWWEKDANRVLAAWSLRAGATLGVELGAAVVTDAFGHQRNVATTADLPLGYFPCYLRPASHSPATAKRVADAVAAARQEDARRAALAQAPSALFDFGSRDHVDVHRGFGIPRRYLPVLKDDLWDAQRGWGFVQAAADNADRHWIRSPRDRDACKVAAGATFRFALPKGAWRIEVGAEAMNGGDLPLTIAGQAATVVGGKVAAVALAGDGTPVEVVCKDWGLLRWITAVPQGK